MPWEVQYLATEKKALQVVLPADVEAAVKALRISRRAKQIILDFVKEKKGGKISLKDLNDTVVEALKGYPAAKRPRSGGYLIRFFDIVEAVAENSEEIIPLLIRLMGFDCHELTRGVSMD
jgi:hypothetical protein